MNFCSTNWPLGGFADCVLLKYDHIIWVAVMNLVTLKAAAKHELLFNEPAPGLNL